MAAVTADGSGPNAVWATYEVQPPPLSVLQRQQLPSLFRTIKQKQDAHITERKPQQKRHQSASGAPSEPTAFVRLIVLRGGSWFHGDTPAVRPLLGPFLNHLPPPLRSFKVGIQTQANLNQAVDRDALRQQGRKSSTTVEAGPWMTFDPVDHMWMTALGQLRYIASSFSPLSVAHPINIHCTILTTYYEISYNLQTNRCCCIYL